MTTTDPIIEPSPAGADTRRSRSRSRSTRTGTTTGLGTGAARDAASTGRPPQPATRDRALDLVRSASLVVVVLLHGMMAGISIDSAHQVVVTNALEGQPWFVPLSWLVQVMPLFFIVGGFAGITQWRRVRSRGGGAVDFVRSRLERLARPAVVVFGTIAAGLGVASLAGASPELLAQLGFRMAQPLWFLAVYLGVSSLVPVFAAAHDRAPRRTIVALAGAALVIDVLRTTSGLEGLGYLNLGFVWLAVQQLGFWWADGVFTKAGASTKTGASAPLHRIRSLGGIVGSLIALLALCGTGLSSPDLYDALNPPTSALILLGLAQAFALGALHRRLTAIAEDPQVRRMTDAVGSRSMTIYLWHMPVLVTIAAVLLLSGVVWPLPLSGAWWLTRGVWLGAILVSLVPVAAIMGRFERGLVGRPVTRVNGSVTRPVQSATNRATNAISSRALRAELRTAVSVGLAIAGVLGVLIGGFTVLTAVTGTLLLGAALRLATADRPVSSPEQPARAVHRSISPEQCTGAARRIE